MENCNSNKPRGMPDQWQRWILMSCSENNYSIQTWHPLAPVICMLLFKQCWTIQIKSSKMLKRSLKGSATCLSLQPHNKRGNHKSQPHKTHWLGTNEVVRRIAKTKWLTENPASALTVSTSAAWGLFSRLQKSCVYHNQIERIRSQNYSEAADT